MTCELTLQWFNNIPFNLSVFLMETVEDVANTIEAYNEDLMSSGNFFVPHGGVNELVTSFQVNGESYHRINNFQVLYVILFKSFVSEAFLVVCTNVSNFIVI